MDRNADALRASKKQSQIRSFNRLLGVMNHQRILVMAIAVAQTVIYYSSGEIWPYFRRIFLCFSNHILLQALSHFILFLVCLGLIHAKEIADIMLLDRLDQKEREEYYETPKIHGVSTNDIRFMEADKLSTYTLVIMYIATAIAGVYALCTLGLLIGTFIDLSFITFPCESVIHRFFSHSHVQVQ